ncbi:hypothetical protein BC828DRAFT_391287, partial [Blastocladiella britannica]
MDPTETPTSLSEHFPPCCAGGSCAAWRARDSKLQFYRAGLSPHYTDRVSRTLTGFIAVQGAGSIAFLVNTYIEQAWQPAFTTHPLRKLFMMQELGTCVIVDMCLNVATFRAVWGLRSAVLKRKAAQGNQQQRSGRSTTSRSSARNSGHGGNYTGSGLDSVPDMVFATSTTAAPAIRLGKMISFSDGVPDGPHLPHNSSTSGGGVASSKSDHNLIPRQPSSMSLKSLSASIAQLPTVVAARETIRRNLGERSVVRSEILFHCAIVLFCVVCMVISALMGAAVFILSTSMLGDAIGLLGTRLYVLGMTLIAYAFIMSLTPFTKLGTIIQWLYIIRIL